ncbi:lysylphosphatidylglycerol synthase transmembrane domain-containing protein [Acaryochloris sp. CCMEE 5410]|uniref:lysylphosphatidylglycerol synthase transmembrane domain-containing protein n=1 Tax=Acaryochloris sp. CCMEE 5410 TaxID=310037 RepID=UPI00024844D7|nr:lysylphosphatidylglycerol synthase transmembrane domain-containing protein [Acaryochloris sp. CCMEE 5410]KAI9130991.1 flippase-like domain-containing protein [Acaryochloris sp. CCMEE 5410]
MKRYKRPISIAVSVLILCIIYSKIDFQGLIEVFRNCDLMWMVISLGMVIPLTGFTSWRLQQLMPSGSGMGAGEANKLVLAASTLNMVLPSKMGDIAKAYFIRDRGYLSGTLSVSLVVFEKTCDMLSLLFWCAFGLILYPQKDAFFWTMTAGVVAGVTLGLLLLGSAPFANVFFGTFRKITPKGISRKFKSLQESWQEMQQHFWKDRVQLAKVSGTSIFIWFLHMVQIWFFTLALKATVPFIVSLALSPLAILAGLLPLTFAGVGTRDAALIALYANYFDEPTGAALGLLCTMRYFLPAIGGLPFLRTYLATLKTQQKAATDG